MLWQLGDRSGTEQGGLDPSVEWPWVLGAKVIVMNLYEARLSPPPILRTPSTLLP